MNHRQRAESSALWQCGSAVHNKRSKGTGRKYERQVTMINPRLTTYSLKRSNSSKAERRRKNYTYWMVPDGSLPRSQHTVTGPYPVPDQSSARRPNIFIWKKFIYYLLHLHPDLSSGLSPSGFPTKTLQASLLYLTRSTWPANLVILHLINRIF